MQNFPAWVRWMFVFLALAAAWQGSALAAQEPAAAAYSPVEALFAARCYECHSGTTLEGGLRLNSRSSVLAGGDSGEPAVVPGEPDRSRLIRMIRGEVENLRMPPEDYGDPLLAEEIDVLVQWVAAGANWPDDLAEPQEDLAHWAWHAPVAAALPAVQQTDWPRNGIDYFVLARLEQEGLHPAPPADPHTLLRRVSLDLIGLPPTPEEVQAFAQDTQPGAYERAVDRLLADPRYGERWARMWLDLARYADSKGYGSDPLRQIWRYRDWVIEAFNRNLPYDQFTIEQLAGDLLPGATTEQILATAFHRNTMANDEGGTDDEEFRVAAIKDRVDTTGLVWMGITIGCAKCHSHKYDPITNREYYSFFAYFNQTEDADRGDESPRLPTPTHEQEQQLDDLRQQVLTAQAALEVTSPQVAAAQAAWEQALAGQPVAWTPLEIVSAVSEGGATLQVQPDGALLAAGANPDKDVYTLELRAPLAGVTGLRLEVLPDAALPGSGPGRSPGGNFVLNEVYLAAAATEGQAPQARYVRIELPGAGRLLSLAEVQVFSAGQNIALTGTAAQSSEDYGGVAGRAIDGQTSGIYYEANSVTHTKQEDNPWWEVDLGSLLAVERVAVWNRTDPGVGDRLSGFKLLVLDEQRNVVQEATYATAPSESVELSLGGPQPVALRQATADFAQAQWPPEAVIDGQDDPQRGWAIAPQFNQPHALVVETAAPLGDEGGSLLTLRLVQNFGGQHAIGRLRVSATTAQGPLRELPGEIAAILAVPPDQRTAEQLAAVAAYYRSISPELQAVREQIAQLTAQQQALEQQIPTTPILRELPPDQQRTTRVMIKGNFLNQGDPVAPGVPIAFHPFPESAPQNRLGLAQWLVDARNPLTARVAVNRFWSQLFGAGIVESEEDFGTQGQLPSHPELLDWLAVQFRQGTWNAGAPATPWDVQALLRAIVTSATYRQASTPNLEYQQRDARNRLLWHGPRQRLEAEMIRDQALALAGLLSAKQGGPSVYPPQPEGLWRAAFNGERTWATSPGEDRYRRGLYTYWRRTAPYPSMATFDAPSREICTLRRTPTNTPLQAFVMLNDPVYVEAAQALARRIYAAGGTPAERAAYGLQLCLCRPAREGQVQTLVSLYEQELANYRARPAEALSLATEPLGPLADGQPADELAAWTVVANVLLNLDGVLTKR